MIIIIDIFALLFLLVSLSCLILNEIDNKYTLFIFYFILFLVLFICPHLDKVPSSRTEIRDKKPIEYVGDFIEVNESKRQIVDYYKTKRSYKLDNGMYLNERYFEKFAIKSKIEAPVMKFVWVWPEVEEIKNILR